MNANVGDWVRFYYCGRMVLGIVQYIRTPSTYPYTAEACTDVVAVPLDQILEVRASAKEQE